MVPQHGSYFLQSSNTESVLNRTIEAKEWRKTVHFWRKWKTYFLTSNKSCLLENKGTVYYYFNYYSWSRLIWTRLFWIPCYFELKTISLGFALWSFTIGYFELPLFLTIFCFPGKFEMARFNCTLNHFIILPFHHSTIN